LKISGENFKEKMEVVEQKQPEEFAHEYAH